MDLISQVIGDTHWLFQSNDHGTAIYQVFTGSPLKYYETSRKFRNPYFVSSQISWRNQHDFLNYRRPKNWYRVDARPFWNRGLHPPWPCLDLANIKMAPIMSKCEIPWAHILNSIPLDWLNWGVYVWISLCAVYTIQNHHSYPMSKIKILWVWRDPQAGHGISKRQEHMPGEF